ncbi:multi antimicrobial extrusion protein MatE [Paludibacter propionicigenes WB4]|uniref:Multi antimicrobial extrusion protein MatE n=1 Tax=Paludibacter propionicigenes (strain DSM 17365 / JCM 13257 / WB4) TaxID=694427 RepID=E4T1G8_PALPW|nr:MATE family efflux transporter [Paludibacter propionicigenes]ADQ78562.1 multi antimicrobial extrusion protein MatE [Paludibacter propionicigenes WB4]
MKASNKIIFNTGVLYVRMIITAVLSLLATRWVLKALGSEDYGIFNLVAGVILMLSFLNTAMSVATQRFLSFAIGEGNETKLRQTFYYSLILHLFIGIAIIILFEIGGYFLLYNFLKIPEGKTSLAFFVLHCLSVSTFFTIISVPYQSVINSFENMTFLAFTDVLESILKFLSAFLLIQYLGNRLELYSVLIMSISVLTMIITRVYCFKRYAEVTKLKITKITDYKQFKVIASYAGWNLIGAVGVIAKGQGIAIIMNLFLGVIANAAYGIANQVNGQMSFFSNTILRAIQPQIIKSEGAKNRSRMLELSLSACKFPTLMMSCLVIPIIIKMDYILHLWLSKIPDNSVIFCTLILIYTLIYQFYHGLELSIHAYGKIKWFQITTYSIQIMVIPIGYLLLYFGYKASSILICSIVAGVVNLFVTVYFAKKYCDLDYKYYFNKVLIPISVLIAFNVLFSYFISQFFEKFSNNLISLCVVFMSNTFIICAVGYLCILTDKERNIINELALKIKSILK